MRASIREIGIGDNEVWTNLRDKFESKWEISGLGDLLGVRDEGEEEPE